MAHPGGRSERGAALILVLVLLTVLSLALGAMFANASANLTTSTVIAARNHKVYAADAGVETVIQQLRGDSSLCGVPATAPTNLPPITIDTNGPTVTRSCQTTAGIAGSVSPWALVTKDTSASSLESQSSASPIIDGPVYVNGGVSFVSPIVVPSPSYQHSSTCPLNPTGPWRCTNAPVPDPSPALPPFNLRSGSEHTVGQCSIFLPGKYTSISLGPHNYFASGVYYFENTDITLNGDLFGGQPGPAETTVIAPSPCATDQQAGVDDGTGVELILGGTSTIYVDSHGDMELYRRSPGTRLEGAPGVSIRTVPAGAAPYLQSTFPGNDVDVLAMAFGSSAQLAVHGMVYVPTGTVDLFASTSVADLLGGLECSALKIGQSASGSSGRVISAQAGPQPRYVVITATAQVPAEPGVTSTAVVAIGNDPARTVTIHSWITANP
jgi:hypothetical protein